MLPTPSTSHVCFDRIYEPAEDSYLLLDTLSSPSEIEFLHARFSRKPTSTTNNVEPSSSPRSACPLALEVGVGSGVVLAFLAANAKTLLGRSDVLTLGTDLNRYACEAAAQTVRNALKESSSSQSSTQTATAAAPSQSILLDVLNADLASSLAPHTVDILVFNPPYVPAELPDYTQHSSLASLSADQKPTFEQDSYLLELSYAGGDEGMVVTNRMLEQIPQVLSLDRGVAYVLLCAQNKPEVVKEKIRGWGEEWRAETVGSSGKKAGWEKLVIVRIWRERGEN